MKIKLPICFIALFFAGTFQVQGGEVKWDHDPIAGFKAGLKEQKSVATPVSEAAGSISKPESRLKCDLLPQFSLIAIKMGGYQLDEMKARIEIIGSNSYRMVPVEKRWDSDPYGYYAVFESVRSVPARALTDYYKTSGRALVDSVQAGANFLDLLKEGAKNAAYTSEELRMLDNWALEFLPALSQRADAVAGLTQAYMRAADQIHSSEVVFADPKAAAEFINRSYDLLNGNSSAVLSVIKDISNLPGSCDRVGLYPAKSAATVIAQKPGETAQEALAALSKALGEEKTTFLIFRSSAKNEETVKAAVARAENMTAWNPAEWRVIWIKDADMLSSSMVKTYFGDDESISAASLRWGTGTEREVVKRYDLSGRFDNIDIGGAFAEAGPK